MSPLRVSGVSSQYLATDVEYLHRISCVRSIHGDFTLEMAIRGIIIESDWIYNKSKRAIQRGVWFNYIWNISNLELGMWYQISYNPLNYQCNFCNCICWSLKNSGLQQGLNPWPRDTSVSILSNFPIWNYLKHSVNIISHCSELDESKVSDATGSNGSCYDISWQGKQQQ